MALTRVDPSTLEAFRSWVLERHGKLYGVLKEEATQALDRHMDASEASDEESTVRD